MVLPYDLNSGLHSVCLHDTVSILTSTKLTLSLAQSYLRDLRSLGEVDGLNSGIYSVLTAAFVGAGLGYIFAPAQVGAPKTASTASICDPGYSHCSSWYSHSLSTP